MGFFNGKYEEAKEDFFEDLKHGVYDEYELNHLSNLSEKNLDNYLFDRYTGIFGCGESINAKILADLIERERAAANVPKVYMIIQLFKSAIQQGFDPNEVKELVFTQAGIDEEDLSDYEKLLIVSGVEGEM